MVSRDGSNDGRRISTIRVNKAQLFRAHARSADVGREPVFRLPRQHLRQRPDGTETDETTTSCGSLGGVLRAPSSCRERTCSTRVRVLPVANLAEPWLDPTIAFCRRDSPTSHRFTRHLIPMETKISIKHAIGRSWSFKAPLKSAQPSLTPRAEAELGTVSRSQESRHVSGVRMRRDTCASAMD